MQVFLHSSQDVLIPQICRGNDGQGGLQLRSHVLLVMAGRQPHIPKGEEQEAHRQNRGQKIVPHQDCQRTAKTEQGQTGCTDHGKTAFPARHGQDLLSCPDFPAKHTRLLSAGGLVDFLLYCPGLLHQEAKQAVCKFHRF